MGDLRGNEELQRLVRGLLLSQGFAFYQVTSSSPAVADEALDVLRVEVAQQRGAPVRLVRHAPAVVTPVTVGIPAEAALAIVDELMNPAPEDQPHGILHVVDASRALTVDDPAWVALFKRMNERRNEIVQALGGELLLVAPRRLQVEFAFSAPDFASIFSGAIALTEPERVPQAEPLGVVELVPWDRVSRSTISALTEEVLATRTWLADSDVPDANTQGKRHQYRRHLAEALVRLGEVYAAREQLDLAMDRLTRARSILHELADLEISSGEVEWKRDLAVVHERIGRLHEMRGEMEQALESYKESLDFSRRGRNEDLFMWIFVRHEIVIGLDLIGHTHWVRGDIEKSMACYQEALDVVESVSSGWTERNYTHSVVLIHMAHALRQWGDLPRACRAHEEAIALRREFHKLDERRAGRHRALAASLLLAGEAYRCAGALERARELCEEAVAHGRKLAASYPRSWEILRTLSASLAALANVHRGRGDAGAAAEVDREALQVNERLRQIEPTPRWLEDRFILREPKAPTDTA